jgi:hypothetical protein
MCGGTYKANHLDAPRIELVLELRERAELGRADGCKVGRVGEQDGPAVADELVEVDLALRRQGLEVGSCSTLPD